MINRKTTVAVCLLAALAGFAGAASAQDAKTRAQVESELSAAMANGDMLSPSGIPDRVLRPDLYPQAQVTGKTRAQVKAELATAIRNGDMLAAGDSGLREKDLYPSRYPADPVVAGKSRQQVEAELATAIRNGDMLAPGELGLRENQLEPQFYAQRRDTTMPATMAAGGDAGIASQSAQ
jgi:hypothetical protein